MKNEMIWVVEQGCYSDYGVVGVFTSRENAQTVADAINGSEYSYDKATVAEWPLNPAVDGIRKGLHPFFVQMTEDGTVERAEKKEVARYDLNGEVRMWRRSTAPAYIGKGLTDVLWVTTWAKDEKHAIKITNEHRTRMIADGSWRADPVAATE